MRRPYLTAPAETDLQQIFDYIAAENRPAAERLVERIMATCRMLASFDSSGERCEQLAPSLRRFTHGNYVIFFRHTDRGIDVLRILHGARSIDAAFFEEES